eukprot:12426151-Karenia_brevis.AAC.1
MRDAIAGRNKRRGRSAFQGRGVHRLVSRSQGKAPAPMGYIKRQADTGFGKSKGSITTDLEKIDDILHETWDSITCGN